MSWKEGYATLTPTLQEDYSNDGVTPFIPSKNYDETISVIHSSKIFGSYKEQYLQQQTKISIGTKRILLIDDEEDINLTIKLILEGSGFEVDSFTDPLLALDSFKRGLYDLVILDVKMPIMNGFGLYQEIRKLDTKVKICFLTAAGDVYYKAFGKQAFPNINENCVIRVPIGNELLIKQIKSIMS